MIEGLLKHVLNCAEADRQLPAQLRSRIDASDRESEARYSLSPLSGFFVCSLLLCVMFD